MNQFLLQHLLRTRAERYPDKKAVGFFEICLSYRELEEKSTQLANLFFEAGLVRSSGVGIFLNKSIESVISFFAVPKAGCFYVPLDSGYSPLKRTIGIVLQNEIGFIITNSSL